MNNTVKKTVQSFLLAASLASVSVGSSMAQRSFGGVPLSFSATSLQEKTASDNFRIMPKIVEVNFNVDDLLTSSSWATARMGRPAIIGRLISCDYNFCRDAQLIQTVNGVNVYRLIIATEGAPAAVNLYYKDFYIPKGGRLYIYDQDQRTLLGAYTNDTHPKHGAFATEPVPGKTLVLEYEAPEGTEAPSIEVESLGYMFHSVFRSNSPGYGLDFSDPYVSTACQININCEEGAAWQTEKEGVVTYIQLIKSEGEWVQSACSGNLMNNSKGDFKPYILTAAHCSGEEASTTPTIGKWNGKFEIPQDKMDQWLFGFHYERPRCSNGEFADHNMKTMTGCKIRSYLSFCGYSDGMLLELNQEVPEDYRVYYNGYDANETIHNEGVGIHHPAADSKKIALFNGGVNISFWKTVDSRGGANDHYTFNYTKGATEGGSSGSSIFNKEKLVIGTLTGGASVACGGLNWYGRLSSHWDKYKDKGDLYHMNKFLDPENKGKVLKGTWRNGFKPLENIKSINSSIDTEGKTIVLSWEPLPKHEQGYKISYRVFRGDKVLADVTEAKFSEPITAELKALGGVRYAVVPRYHISQDKEEATAPIYTSVYLGQLNTKVAEEDVVVSFRNPGNLISWKSVVNAQVVSKFSPENNTYLTVGVPSGMLNKNYSRLWITDVWRTAMFGAEDLYLSQINFVPSQLDKTINLLVDQRGVSPLVVSVKVPNDGTNSTSKMHKVLLKKPFKVDTKQNLWVGYQMRPATPYGMRIVLDSKDSEYEQNGLKTFILGYGNAGTEEIFDVTHIYKNEVTREGYLAMELVFTNRAEALHSPIEEPWIHSRTPVQFPAVKGYRVYKNGALLTTTQDPNKRSVEDTDGQSGDVYSIEAVYNYPDALDVEKPLLAAKNIYAYPAFFDDYLFVNDAYLVRAVRMYDANGVLIRLLEGKAIYSIETQDLSAGTYVVVIETEAGKITQKVIKRG